MNATEWYRQLLNWGWDREQAQSSVKRWFNRDAAQAAFKAVR